MLEDVIRKYGGVEVTAMEVYSDIFNLGEHEIQTEGEKPGKFKANPVGYWKNQDRQKGHYRILFEDTFEEVLKELQKADFSILNGLTYFGRKNLQENASKIYAMIIDYDGVTDQLLNNFLHGAFVKDYDIYPVPNYIALSGHGIHLYYVFESPISLYPNIKLQLKAFKYAMIEKIWNMYTSEEEHKQFQGINQGFRVIGGKTKIPGVVVRAFRLNSHPYTLTELGKYIPEESRVDEKKIWKESRMSIQEARKKYPEWYEKKVVRKEARSYWQCKEDLYQWWIEKIKAGATYRHRYFSIMCLAIYGVKCGKRKEDVEADALSLVPFLNDINPEEPFTEQDVYSAMECFDMKYCTFPINDIVKISGISIAKNKRNGRKQAQHIKIMNAIRDIEYPNGEWRIGNGRPSAESQILNYLYEHPEATKKQIKEDTGLSYPTIRKYYDKCRRRVLLTPTIEEVLQEALLRDEKNWLRQCREEEKKNENTETDCR